MIITHIIKEEKWNEIKNDKLYYPDSLETDKFIHCSNMNQACKVADYIYPEESGIILLVIDSSKLESKVIWEDLYELNEEYPHIYGPLEIDSIIKIVKLSLNSNNKFELPRNVLD